MKYYLEYNIKERVWKIYDITQPEGYPSTKIMELTSELFDKLIEEFLEKCKEN